MTAVTCFHGCNVGMQQRPTHQTDYLSNQIRVFTNDQIILHPRFVEGTNPNSFDYDIALVSSLLTVNLNRKNHEESTLEAKILCVTHRI